MADQNPVAAAFQRYADQHQVWGQVSIERAEGRFRLRHVDDRTVPFETLRAVPTAGLRELATFNQVRQFRPLRAAPDLQKGWVWTGGPPAELVCALQEIYPASIVDWFALESSTVAPTGYREFTNRQSGMYRITQLLTDSQAGQVIRACCAPGFCLKRRFWTVEGLEADGAAGKSAIPCLEPCAVLLELARKAARIEQEEKITVQLSPSDWEGLLSAARSVAAGQGRGGERVGNVASAVNPRRLQLLLEKYAKTVDAGESRAEE